MTASQRGKNSPRLVNEGNEQSEKPYHARSMSWAQRLKRVFNIDITQCENCTNHNVKIIACITDPLVSQKILDHLDNISSPIITPLPSLLPPLRAPPKVTFDDSHTIQRDFDWGA